MSSNTSFSLISILLKRQFQHSRKNEYFMQLPKLHIRLLRNYKSYNTYMYSSKWIRDQHLFLNYFDAVTTTTKAPMSQILNILYSIETIKLISCHKVILINDRLWKIFEQAKILWSSNLYGIMKQIVYYYAFWSSI